MHTKQCCLPALLAAALAATASSGRAQGADGPAPPSLRTRWGQDVPTRPDFYQMAYPRPQLCRPDGQVLDGLWRYAVTGGDQIEPPAAFSGEVLVPFPIGSPSSPSNGRQVGQISRS